MMFSNYDMPLARVTVVSTLPNLFTTDSSTLKLFVYCYNRSITHHMMDQILQHDDALNAWMP